jgi:hypothetical protein
MKTIYTVLFALSFISAGLAQTNRFAATVFSVRTNDLSITNQTNFTSTELSFNTQANASYIVTLYPILQSSVTNGTEVIMAVTNATALGTWSSLASSILGTNQVTNAIDLNVTSARSLFQTFYVKGGTNAGSVTLQFRSTAATNTNTIKAGSFIRVDKMPQ